MCLLVDAQSRKTSFPSSTVRISKRTPPPVCFKDNKKNSNVSEILLIKPKKKEKKKEESTSRMSPTRYVVSIKTVQRNPPVKTD